MTDPAAPLPAPEDRTLKINEARAALLADPERIVDVLLLCRELVLSFDERLHAVEKRTGILENEALAEIRRLIKLVPPGLI